jgi:hypothetical protein
MKPFLRPSISNHALAPSILAKLYRDATVSFLPVNSRQSAIIGDGTVNTIPPSIYFVDSESQDPAVGDVHLNREEMTLFWEGELRVNEDISFGSFSTAFVSMTVGPCTSLPLLFEHSRVVFNV